MVERHFSQWDYQTVQELERVCAALPILSLDKARAFFKEAGVATGSDAKVVERKSGRLFEGMMGFVGASDRKDLSATWNDADPGTIGYGVLMVATYDRFIGVTFCLARTSGDTFLTCGWIGEDNRKAVEGLR